MTNQDPKTLPYEEAAALAFDAVIGRWATAYPEAVIDVATFGPNRHEHVSIADTAAVVKAAQNYHYIGVNPLATKPTEGRGVKTDRIGHIALIVDIDLASKADEANGHKTSKPLPTMAQSRELIAEASRLIGHEPTIVVQTSRWGIHAWWALDEVIEDSKDNPVLRGWKNLWTTMFDERGLHIDKGVVACNVAQVLRLPGQTRIKGDAEPYRSQLVRYNPDSITPVAGLANRLPQPLPKAKVTATSKTTGKALAKDSTYTPSKADEVVAEWEVIPFLDAVFYGTVLSDTHWLREGSENSHSVEQVHGDDGFSVIVSSSSMSDALGVEPQSADHARLSVASLLSRVVFNNWATAQKVMDYMVGLGESEAVDWLHNTVEQFDIGTDDLEAWQTANRSAIAEMFAPVTEDVVTEAVVTPDEPSPIIEALRTMDGSTHKVIGGDYKLVIGGKSCGTYKMVMTEDEDGNPVEDWKRLTTAVVVRTAVSTLLRPVLENEDTTSYDVTVVVNKRRKVLHNLDPAKSVDIGHILTMAGIGGWVPESYAKRAEVNNIIANVALDDAKRTATYGRGGWSDEGGMVRYVTQTNSIDKNGIGDLSTEVPKARAVTALIGMPTDDDFARAPEMLAEMMAIYPTGQGTVAAIVANAISAPVRVTGPNCAVFISGRAETGKTRITGLGTMWVQPGQREPQPAIDIKEAAAQSVSQTLAVEGDIVSLFDDLKVTGGEGGSKIASRRALAHAAIAGCHDRKGRTYGSRSGRVVGGQRIDGSAYITSELGIEDHSMRTKSLVVPEVKAGAINFEVVTLRDAAGTVVLAPDGQPEKRTAFDAIMGRWSATAQRLYAGWIDYLREDIEHVGSIADWTRANESERATTVARLTAATSGSASRPVQLVGRLIHGWTRFTEYLAEHGVDVSELPDFNEHLTSLVAVAANAAEEMKVENRLAAALRDKLETKQGFLATGAGKAPDKYGRQVGWLEGSFDMTSRGTMLGHLSDDGERVLMKVEHARYLLADAGTQALKTALAELTVGADNEPYEDADGRSLRGAWSGLRTRGYVIPVAALGLDFGDDDEEAK